jgi:hypothetical protein
MSWLLCRWLLVRVGLVCRLLAGEAVRGEGREYGCMAAASCRYERAEGVTGLSRRTQACQVGRLWLRRKQARMNARSHHECSQCQVRVVAVRNVSQETGARGDLFERRVGLRQQP